MKLLLLLVCVACLVYICNGNGNTCAADGRIKEQLPFIPESAFQYLFPRPDVTAYWENEIIERGYTRVAEFGPGGEDRRFPHANIVVDHFSEYYEQIPNVLAYEVDIDFERVPVDDNAFDFVYSRHLLEDIHNPVGAFREMTRLSRRGYIETPSPYLESLWVGPPHRDLSGQMPGFVHHRFLFWTNASTNTLYALPKYPLINNITRPREEWQRWVDILTEHGPFFNNYYQWDLDKGLLPKLVMLKHGREFLLQFPHTYANIISDGGATSVQYTIKFFFDYINPFWRNKHFPGSTN